MIANLSSWVLSIAGIVLISTLVELILPDGQMNKYIKGIMAFIIVFVIVSPIPRLIGKGENWSVFNFTNSINYDEETLNQINFEKIETIKNEIIMGSEKLGYKNIKVKVNAQTNNRKLKIKSIYVDLTQLVILTNAEHKDISKIKKDITTIIVKYVKIKEEDVLYEN